MGTIRELYGYYKGDVRAIYGYYKDLSGFYSWVL